MSPAVSSGSSMSPEPKPGNVYLVEERRPKASYELFDQALAAGYSGLVVTRDFPKKLLSEKELGTCKVLWLTNLVGEGRINPTAIGILMGQIRNFIENQPRTVVVLDGMEYLVSLNTYDRMLQFMHQLRDVVVTNESIMLVPVDPRTMSQREVAMLERSMEPIVPKSESELHDDGMLGSGDVGVLRLLDVGSR
ncbi:MAG TPA: DUF835 domain-containing protein [Thermoplasmata archaeon]